MRQSTILTILIALVATAVLSAQKEQLFPHTKKQGRATTEYRHEGFHVVVNYDYSQRNHSGAWLLIDVAMASNTRFVLHRDNFSIVSPEGQTLKLATQENLAADGPGLWSLSQNSKIHRQNLDGFFAARSRELIKFFSFPFERAISNESIVDNDRMTTGALLFKSPESSWQAGTYRLAIDNEKAKAALPIALQ
jgi:hypothetical protein